MKFAPAKLPFVPREFVFHTMLSLFTIPAGVAPFRGFDVSASTGVPASVVGPLLAPLKDAASCVAFTVADAHPAADEAAFVVFAVRSAWSFASSAGFVFGSACALASFAAAASRSFASCVAFLHACVASRR